MIFSKKEHLCRHEEERRDHNVKNSERFIYLRILYVVLFLMYLSSYLHTFSIYSQMMAELPAFAISDDTNFQAFVDEVVQRETESLDLLNTDTSSPNDPLFQDQWNLHSFDGAQQFGTDWEFIFDYIKHITVEDPQRLSPVLVTVLDSGLNANHIDMSTSAVFINPLEIPNDHVDNDGNGYIDDVSGCGFIQGSINCQNVADNSSTQHGTGVSGMIVAGTDNHIGLSANTGVPITIVPVKVIMPDGIANYSDIGAGLQYVIDLLDQGFPIRVVNMSFAGFPMNTPSADAKITELLSRGVILVAGSGNSSIEYPGVLGWPARHDGVIAVSGSTNTGVRHPHANYGQGVDVVAPYGPVRTLCYTEEFCTLSGTSFSAPQVTLLVATLLSLEPNLTQEEITKIITQNAKQLSQCLSNECGSGLINYMSSVLHHKTYLPVVSR